MDYFYQQFDFETFLSATMMDNVNMIFFNFQMEQIFGNLFKVRGGRKRGGAKGNFFKMEFKKTQPKPA